MSQDPMNPQNPGASNPVPPQAPQSAAAPGQPGQPAAPRPPQAPVAAGGAAPPPGPPQSPAGGAGQAKPQDQKPVVAVPKAGMPVIPVEGKKKPNFHAISFRIQCVEYYNNQWQKFFGLWGEGFEGRRLSQKDEQDFHALVLDLTLSYYKYCEMAGKGFEISYRKMIFDMLCDSVSLSHLKSLSISEFRRLMERWHKCFIEMSKVLGKLISERSAIEDKKKTERALKKSKGKGGSDSAEDEEGGEQEELYADEGEADEEESTGGSGKSVAVAYLLLIFLGAFGAHRIYLGKPLSNILIYVFTCGYASVGFWIDLFTLPKQIRDS